MGKIEHIRTMELEPNSILIILKVIGSCNLSKMLLVFKGLDEERKIPLPNERVSDGDFIWITNMNHKDVMHNMSGNSSKTKTLILHINSDKINLTDFVRIEEM